MFISLTVDTVDTVVRVSFCTFASCWSMVGTRHADAPDTVSPSKPHPLTGTMTETRYIVVLSFPL